MQDRSANAKKELLEQQTAHGFVPSRGDEPGLVDGVRGRSRRAERERLPALPDAPFLSLAPDWNRDAITSR